MTWHHLIREARLRAGLGQKALGQLVGVSQASINKIEQGQVDSTAALGLLIETLKLDPALFPDAAYGKGARIQSALTVSQPVLPVPEFARDPSYWAAAAGLIGDVPLYASAEGGDGGSLIIERDSIGTRRRHASLQGVKDGYAIYIVGGSMVPEFEPGDVLFVNPRLPIIPNVSCVFYSNDEDQPLARVKRFLSQDKNAWLVRQFYPPEEFEMSRERWPVRHRIVAKDFR